MKPCIMEESPKTMLLYSVPKLKKKGNRDCIQTDILKLHLLLQTTYTNWQ
jgi:hypothetical protein